MKTGSITGYIDIAQVVLYAFWIFFAGLLVYLRREDKREGYPLESDRSGRVKVQGFPTIPKPKTFLLADGSVVYAPRVESDLRVIRALPNGPHLGAPLVPTGNPLIDAVGPASYALRANHPDHTIDGQPLIVPTRVAAGYTVSSKDPDPRGMGVYGADRELAGIVRELWIDRAEPQIRYLELETAAAGIGAAGIGAAGVGTAGVGTNTGALRRVLLPINFAKIDGSARRVNVRSILASQFATVPAIASPDQITRREEDQIMAYYAGGVLYATAARAEPLL